MMPDSPARCVVCTDWNTPPTIRRVCSANKHWPSRKKNADAR